MLALDRAVEAGRTSSTPHLPAWENWTGSPLPERWPTLGGRAIFCAGPPTEGNHGRLHHIRHTGATPQRIVFTLCDRFSVGFRQRCTCGSRYLSYIHGRSYGKQLPGLYERWSRFRAMISEGVKVRAQIDAESVRHVLLVNGGGCVALLALLPSMVGTPLVFGVLVALAIWLIGLTFAVIHSVLRRKCSLVYEHHSMNPPHGAPRFGINPRAPWVCWWSWRCLYGSILAFLLGGAAVVAFGFANLDALNRLPDTAPDKKAAAQAEHNNSLQPTARPILGFESAEVDR